MKTPGYTARFNRDLKLAKKRGKDISKLKRMIRDICNEVPPEEKHREHMLKGEYDGFTECHIEPDWLLST